MNTRIMPAAAASTNEALNTVLHPWSVDLRYNSVIHPVAKGPGATPAWTYSSDELIAAAARGSVLLVHHGAAPEIEGYQRRYIHTEVLPVFVSRNTRITNLSLDDLGAMLEGRITNWKDAGSGNLPVTIIAQGEAMKRRALDFQFATRKLRITDCIEAGGYSELERISALHAGALVLGLRGAPANRDHLRAIAIDGHTPMSGKAYPFRVPISLYLRSDSGEAVRLAGDLLRQAKQRAIEDGMDPLTITRRYSFMWKTALRKG